MLTAEYIRSQIKYDPNTGDVWWREKRSKRNMEKPVGYFGGLSRNYLYIKINYKSYSLHRIIWLYVTGKWPEIDIDHKDRNPKNNKWCNLRLATKSQNEANKSSKNKFKGVTYYKKIKKWVARIGYQEAIKNIGTFDCPAAAHFAYQVESDKIYGEYARIR